MSRRHDGTVGRRRLFRCVIGLPVAALLTAMPARLERDGLLLKLSAEAAIAKNGNGGGNNGGGKGGDSSKGEAAGKGDKGHGGGKGKKGGEAKAGRKSTSPLSPLTRTVKRSGRNVELVYPEGFREEISNGNYVMRDAQGRTIVARRATDRDRIRLDRY